MTEQRTREDWTKPAAMAIPKGGFDPAAAQQGRYGPVFPKSPTCYGFSILAKIIPGREEVFYGYAKTIEKTIEYAKEINPHTIQVSLAAPYPGTTLYKQAIDNGWLEENKVINLVSKEGVQLAAIGYPHLSREDIYHHLEIFYKRFYFRPSKIWEILREMLTSWDMMKRRLREGVEFFRFLRAHQA